MIVHSDAKGVSVPTGLIERLEAASAGSRELDEAVCWPFVVASGRGREVGRLKQVDVMFGFGDADWRARGPYDVASPVTTSLDAALALAERMLPDHDWSVGCLPVVDDCDSEEHHHFGALLYSNSRNASWEDGMAHGATPALALCIAILKATTASAVGMERDSAECAKPLSPDEPRKAEESNGGGHG